MSENNSPKTLAQLIDAATTLPELAAGHLADNQRAALKAMQASDAINLPFNGFVLDSRQLKALSDNQTSDTEKTEHQTDDRQAVYDAALNNQSAFVLLSSHSQPLEKSVEYAKIATKTAAFILSEVDIVGLDDSFKSSAIPVIYVPHIREILGTLIQLSLLPANQLNQLINQQAILLELSELSDFLPTVVAVTGTNGKTTISQLVAQLCGLSQNVKLSQSAVMGTAGNGKLTEGRLQDLVQARHTTEDVLAVHTFLQQMAKRGVNVLALEASSHGLHQQRLQGVPITVAIYSNLSRDHLDYHSDMDDYASAKARLFDKRYFPKLTHAIINLDDDFAPLMIKTAERSKLIVWTYSLQPTSHASFVATAIEPSLTGAHIELTTPQGKLSLDSPLLGRFNVANLLAAVAGAMALGLTLQEIPALVQQLQGASGRMQRVTPNTKSGKAGEEETAKATFIVDYAHTPDALTQVLTSLKPHCEGELWAVFGCGGDRDRGKRPLMAQAGLAMADKVILTADNPRSEDPVLILQDMQQGMSAEQGDRAQIIADRREAINQAVKQAGSQDIVVIAGKGHETYQEINGVRYDFDDVVVLQDAFNNHV